MMTLVAFLALAIQDPPAADKAAQEKIAEVQRRLEAATDEAEKDRLRKELEDLTRSERLRQLRERNSKKRSDDGEPVPPRPAQPPQPPRPPVSDEERERLVRTEAELTARIEKNPKDAEAYWSRGETRQRLGNATGAAADFQAARQMSPEFRGRNVPMPPRRGPEGAPLPEGSGAPAPRLLEDPDTIRAWLKENEPETYKRVMEAQEAGRRPDVMRMLSEAEPRMRQLNDIKERDPRGFERTREMRRLEGESLALGERARQAPPDERERIVKELGQVLQKLFDVREENRAREVSELKRRVEALEKELSNRKANKDRIVEQRRRELLGEKGELDW